MASEATNSHCLGVIRLSRVTPAPCVCFEVHRTRQGSRGDGVGAERSTEPQEVLPGAGVGGSVRTLAGTLFTPWKASFLDNSYYLPKLNPCILKASLIYRSHSPREGPGVSKTLRCQNVARASRRTNNRALQAAGV